MGRKDDLERRIRDSYKIIRQYEEIAQTSDRPEEKARAWRKMEEQREHINGYLEQYNPLCQALKRAPPEDIAEIIVIASMPFPEPGSSNVPPEAAIPAPDTPTYHLVDIRIFEASSEEGGYPVELTVSGGRDFPRGQLQLDKSALLALSADSEAYGRALGKTLFAEGAIGDAYQETLAVFQSQGDQVRVRLRLDSPSLHNVRWERIYHPIAGSWHPLAATADTLLSRYVPVRDWGQAEPLAVRPVHALVVLASPNNLGEHNLADISDDEIKSWHALFDNLHDVDVTYLQSATSSPPTFDAVRRVLLDGYHIVHFVCHGAKTRQGTALYLEDNDGLIAPVKAERILETFRALTTRPHLCFLAACESGSRGSTNAFIPLGPALVAEGGVPAVVAMADRVGIVTARQFADQFYERTLTHGIVDLAVHQARATVRERWDWSVPVLFSRLPDNRLFGTSQTPLLKGGTQ